MSEPLELPLYRLVGPRLKRVLDRLGAGRIGETAVVSRSVHIVDPRDPDAVQVLLSADAGQTFYHRRHAGEVLHLDVFHSAGPANHRDIAARLCRRLGELLRVQGDSPGMLDHIDIQTGTGGGRITGSLSYGRKASLRRAHSNHVHLALQLVPGSEWLLAAVVDIVESALVDQGLEPRAVQRLVRLTSARNGPQSGIDLSPYASRSDSLLKERPGTGEPGRSTTRDTLPDDEPPGMELLGDAVRLVDDLRSIYDAWELLQDLDAGREVRQGSAGSRSSQQLEPILRMLERRELVRRQGRETELTDRGRRLLRLFSSHLREIELALKKKVRSLTETHRDGALGHTRKLLREEWRGLSTRAVVPLADDQWIGELALADTIVAAMTSSMQRRGLTGEEPLLSIGRSDLRMRARRRRHSVDVCLLIDASASMAGERLRAAKYLAQHLLFATRDRVAVLTFQERRCDLQCHFTRSYLQIEKGLRSIQPFGLTPLADGLCTALAYIKNSHKRNALLLLITDGIPTVPRSTVNPLDDALEAADRLREARVPMACVGLQPNQRYLEELVNRAGGSLYVVDELERETLVAIAHKERTKQRRK